eukprot:1644424-Rhodomonas_salina.2
MSWLDSFVDSVQRGWCCAPKQSSRIVQRYAAATPEADNSPMYSNDAFKVRQMPAKCLHPPPSPPRPPSHTSSHPVILLCIHVMIQVDVVLATFLYWFNLLFSRFPRAKLCFKHRLDCFRCGANGCQWRLIRPHILFFDPYVDPCLLTLGISQHLNGEILADTIGATMHVATVGLVRHALFLSCTVRRRYCCAIALPSAASPSVFDILPLN